MKELSLAVIDILDNKRIQHMNVYNTHRYEKKSFLALTSNKINKFATLFLGNAKKYGWSKSIGYNKEKRKIVTDNALIKKPLTTNDYKNHLSGIHGLGIIPIKQNNQCNFWAIDIDVYNKPEFLHEIVKKVYKHNLPVYPFFTKSKGLHLYCFLSEEVTAKKASTQAKILAAILDLGKVETFPKQNKLSIDNQGNYINLPFFGCYSRMLINENLETSDFFTCIDSLQTTTYEEMNNAIDNLPFSDAPPCLQSLLLKDNKDIYHRNDFIFSVGRYFKEIYGDDFEKHVIEINNQLNPPMSLERLNKTVLSTHKNHSYFYKCSDEPIVSRCNKEICKKRKFGLGDSISNLNFGRMIQVMTEPPYYLWDINGVDILFETETDFTNQEKFSKLCVRHVHYLPPKIKNSSWSNVVNEALASIEVREQDKQNNASPGAIFLNYLVEFLAYRPPAKIKTEILRGYVFLDEKHDLYIFKLHVLMEFLRKEKKFLSFGQIKIQDILEREYQGKAKSGFYVNKKQKSERVWTLPKSSIEQFITKEISSDEEDFNYLAKEEKF